MQNHLDNTPISVCAISEETPVPSVARALSHFFISRHSVLLYRRSAYHFHHYDVGVVRRVVSYALLYNSLFYREIAGVFIWWSISEGLVMEHPKVPVIFSKWGAIRLQVCEYG